VRRKKKKLIRRKARMLGIKMVRGGGGKIRGKSKEEKKGRGSGQDTEF